jgi:hypothetical protein
MAVIRKGTFSVADGGVAQNLVLGFIPSYFKMTNYTQTYNSGGSYPAEPQVLMSEWYNDLANGSAYNWTSGADGVMSFGLIVSNGFTPYATPDASLFPSSNLAITGISKAAQAVITAANSFTSNDYGVTTVTFSNVVGMTQINTLRGVVQSATSGSFVVNINTTGFSSYVSGGIANIITGIPALQGGQLSSGNAPGFPPAQTNTSQILNAPIYNAGTIGLTMGTSLMVNTSDLWEYVAYLDADFTSA